ncbi:MAG: hypothetical protein RRA92_10250 [Gemmatimonadota bacterium]|nr:hypothetical protein [Gemmatimonadota bacterium]
MHNPKRRPFSDDPYSELPVDARKQAQRVGSVPERALGVLCAEAQADGVPCFELGRDCETCERAYHWFQTRVSEPGS